MIVRKEERATQRVEKMKDGEGYVLSAPILSPETIYNKGRLFGHVVLEKNCEIGWHEHHGEGEAYYIIRGEGVCNDNGNIVTLKTGDAHFCCDGNGHSIKNIQDEPMEMIALVVYN